MFEIRDLAGHPIYSANKAHYLPAVDKGLVGFAPSLERAKNDPRVGNNPLVVKAVNVEGEYNTVVVVSNEDGAKIEKHLAGTKVFREARVIVLLDK